MRSNYFGLPQVALLLALTPLGFASSTWYVNGASGSDSNDCLSSTTACKTIGHAISLAASGDSISVAAATYKENLNIGVSLKVSGATATTTIVDGGGVNTVVTISSGSKVTVSNLTIRNGSAVYPASGGGINNAGTLAIVSSIVSGNSASPLRGCKHFCSAFGGGIANYGTLTVNNSTVTRNATSCYECSGAGSLWGGGIFNSGTLTVNNSTISNNSSRVNGGGMFNDSGRVTINRSTLSGNSAVGGGGGIFDGWASGIVMIDNSTVTGNSAGDGGGIENGGPFNAVDTLTVSNSTIAGNSATSSGGGIYEVASDSGAVATFQNSLVADNTAGGNCAGPVTSHGFNISSDGTCNFSAFGDRNDLDPRLGPLQNNGGPTQTMALLPGSRAVDAGNPGGCTDGLGHLLKTDQRGYPRPDREDLGGCDIGAFEKQSD